MTFLEFSCHLASVGLARPIFVIVFANDESDVKLFKKFKLNLVMIIVSELAHFENQEKNCSNMQKRLRFHYSAHE